MTTWFSRQIFSMPDNKDFQPVNAATLNCGSYKPP